MSTVLVSLAEYLNTAYSPDREYVDGVLVERHVGEFPHSQVQSNFVYYIRQRYPHMFALPEQRMRTMPGRSRVPDVCVMVQKPESDVLDTPPAIVIEILSKRDEMTDVLEKLAEYQSFGVPHIWLIDPRRKKAFLFEHGCLQEVTDTGLAAGTLGVNLPLEDVFRGL